MDLEKLAQTCREKNRWTFFVTSTPANVPGKLPCAVPGFDLTNAEHLLRWCCFPCQWYRYLLNFLQSNVVLQPKYQMQHLHVYTNYALMSWYCPNSALKPPDLLPYMKPGPRGGEGNQFILMEYFN